MNHKYAYNNEHS